MHESNIHSTNYMYMHVANIHEEAGLGRTRCLVGGVILWDFLIEFRVEPESVTCRMEPGHSSYFRSSCAPQRSLTLTKLL